MECCVVICLFMGKHVCLLEEENKIINISISHYCNNTVLVSHPDTPVTSNVRLAPQNSSPDFHTHQPVRVFYSKDGGGRVVSVSRNEFPKLEYFLVLLHFKEITSMQRNIPCRNAVIHRLNHNSKGVGIPKLNSFFSI